MRPLTEKRRKKVRDPGATAFPLGNQPGLMERKVFKDEEDTD